jgi:AcrR family transcriptional regulator
MPYSNLHPTAASLCKTVGNLLDEKNPDLITVEEVLQKSGISKGSLYHHFEDLSDLIETTLITRYTHWIDLSIRSMSKLLETGKTTKSLKDGLFKVTYATQSDAMAKTRLERAQIVAATQNNPRLLKKFTTETDRMTSSFEDLIREVIGRKLFKPNLEPRAIAIFIQAYTFGLVLNDLSENKVKYENWVSLINQIIDEVFIND